MFSESASLKRCGGYIAAALSVVLISMQPAAFAQAMRDVSPEEMAQMEKVMREQFVAADRNGDGKLTREEAKGKMPRVYDNFARIDVEKKGYITLRELEKSLGENVRVTGATSNAK
jgi:Ca2+-binding EF-hand superfamily protein